MDFVKGLLYINGKDVYTEYGAILCHNRQSRNTNYSELLKPPKMKAYMSVDFREFDGEKLPAGLLPRVEARDVTLQLAIIGESKADFFDKYGKFLTMLRSGWLNFHLPDIDRTFRLYYKECSGYNQLTPISANRIAAKFTIKFREPQPAFFDHPISE